MMFGLFWLLVANAASVLGAKALVDQVRTGSESADAVLLILVRLVLLSAAVVLAGVLHILTPLGLGLMGTAALALLLASGVHRSFRLPRHSGVRWPVATAGSLLAAKLLFQTWFFAPYTLDALSYHLPKVGEWIRAGGFVREVGLDSHATFPAGFELVETWWVVFLRHDVLIELAGIEFLVLASAGAYALARHVGASERAAGFAALLYAMIPAFQVMTTSCLNDVPVAAVLVAAAALIAARAQPGLIIMTLGLAVGIKPTAGFALPGLFLYWFLRRREERRSWSLSGSAIALGILGAGLGVMWYARNAALFGNPFHPIGASDFHDPAGNRHIQSGASLASLAANVVSLIDERIYDRRPFLTHLNMNSGWGAVAFACGLPSLVVALFQNPKMRRLTLSFVLSAASVLLLVIHDDWNLRFVLFLPSLLCIAVADVSDRLKHVAPIAWIGLALQFAATVKPADLEMPHIRHLLSQGWRERSLAERYLGIRLDEDSVGYLSEAPGFAYLLYGPDFHRRVVYLRSDTPEGLFQEINRARVRVIYCAAASERTSEFLRLGTRDGRLVPLGGPFYRIPGATDGR
jgi:hypothetical protein